MKLYVYEHCPFCVRARMIFGLRDVNFDLDVIMEGDVETPTRMIGKKMVPILQKDDGSYMGESMDIVHYVDGLGDPVLIRDADDRIAQWQDDAAGVIYRLAVPRFARCDFAELATPEARAYFCDRQEKNFGDLDALYEQSPDLIRQVDEHLERLSPLLAEFGGAPYGVDDITLWPMLHALSLVKGVMFPPQVRTYMERVSKAAKVPLLFGQAL